MIERTWEKIRVGECWNVVVECNFRLTDSVHTESSSKAKEGSRLNLRVSASAPAALPENVDCIGLHRIKCAPLEKSVAEEGCPVCETGRHSCTRTPFDSCHLPVHSNESWFKSWKSTKTNIHHVPWILTSIGLTSVRLTPTRTTLTGPSIAHSLSSQPPSTKTRSRRLITKRTSFP